MVPSMQNYRLKIDVFTPETMPMQRLSLYMAELARVLGEPERVHFVELVDLASTPLSWRFMNEKEKHSCRLSELI